MFCLNGCLSLNAASEADRKATPEYNCEYWKIQKVVSAVKNEKGDISICVRLVNPGKTENPKLKTITLPFSDSTGKITDGTTLESSLPGCPMEDNLYPVEKTQEGCDNITAKNGSSTTFIPIEKLDIGHKDLNMLYDLLNAYNKDQQLIEKIYEVRGKFSKHSLLVYWTMQNSQQSAQPIIIAGTYEDKSTGVYNLLVIPALMADVLYFLLIFVSPFM